jgi:cytochrome c-type biogenesis protein CcmH
MPRPLPGCYVPYLRERRPSGRPVIATLWFIAGLLLGIVGCWFAPRLWPRTRALLSARQPYVVAGGLVVAFAVAAAIIHFAISSRRTQAADPHVTAAAAPAGTAAAPPPAQSMEAAVATLEARLAGRGGSDADWELLAKAYDFLGRADDAKRARAHKVSPAAGVAGGAAGTTSMETLLAEAAAAGNAGASPAAATAPGGLPASPAPSLEELQNRVHDHPRDVSAWLGLAELYRERHDNPAARDALEKVVALHGMTAESWADYADVLGSLAGGSLAGAAASAIDQALALDPRNAKALWLKASQAHEERRFADALGWWQKLRAVLPADSPDVRVIDANIAEDTRLGGFAPAAASTVSNPTASAPAAAEGAEVSGTVAIDSRLAARVQPDSTLFIYAKAADSPGPPLAVLRTTPKTWPVRFRLDDSMAMLPSRRLSQFDKVVVEARISRSGQATPGSGDLFVTSPTLNPSSGQRLALVIDHEIN